MFVDVIQSGGHAHLSYLVGDGGRAVVVDPTRDLEASLDAAEHRGARITHVVDTHTHEDRPSGALELAYATGASLRRGGAGNSRHGARDCRDGDELRVGELLLRVVETPGHTPESISLALVDRTAGAGPAAVFTGDCLLAGAVGRTDLDPLRETEAAGALYDSLIHKLFPLGDGVIVYPAHGCAAIAGTGSGWDRSTIGYERAHNPAVQVAGRDEFVERALERRAPRPPRLPLRGGEGSELAVLGRPRPRSLSADELAARLGDGAVAVDVRSPEAFIGASVPGSLSLPGDLLERFAGWLVPPRVPVVLVGDPGDVGAAARSLHRVGCDDIAGFLTGGFRAWRTSGRTYQNVPSMLAVDLDRRLAAGERLTPVDVRRRDEWQGARLAGAVHAPVGELLRRYDEVPRDRAVVTYCTDGSRAALAASILKRLGFDRVRVCLGSMDACRAVGCANLVTG